jgi:AmiR/NasT family two-component response regulator
MTTGDDGDLPRAVPEETTRRAHLTRVLLAIPEAERHETIERILRSAEHIEVLGAAASGPEALRLTEQLRPDLVIMKRLDTASPV